MGAEGTRTEVCLAQDIWVVAFSPVESAVLSPGTIAKQDNWYLKIHRKCSYHNVIIVMTQKSRIANLLCLSALTFVAYRVPSSSCRIIKREREREKGRKKEIQGNALFMLTATFDLKIPSPEP